MAAIQRTTKQQIIDAVEDLHNLEQMVTREALQAVTGLSLTIIDDRLGALVDDGLIIRKSRGVFVPAVLHPPARLISKTEIPGGLVKIEIGDMVLTLTPREDRMLSKLQAGVAIEYAAVELGQEITGLVASMRNRIGRLESRLRKLEPKAQMDLDGV